MSNHPNNLRTSQAGIDFIKRHEGLRLRWYADVGGKPTIGYGHLMNTREQKELVTITLEQAEAILLSDVRGKELLLNSVLHVSVSQNQYDALVSLAFNVRWLSLEQSTLLKKLNAGDVKGAADEFPRWNKVRMLGGEFKTSRGLERRRLAERLLFLGVTTK